MHFHFLGPCKRIIIDCSLFLFKENIYLQALKLYLQKLSTADILIHPSCLALQEIDVLSIILNEEYALFNDINAY